MRKASDRSTTMGKADFHTIRQVAPYLWPDDNPGAKIRVVSALLLLVLAKVANIITPFFFKDAVDALSGQGVDVLVLAPVGLVLAYGAARVLSIGFANLRDSVFSPVGQQALRRLALKTFRHIHALSLRYHLERKTGALSRIIDRGVKGVEFLLRFLLFSIFPLAIELLMVAVVFLLKFNLWYFLIILATIFTYVVFTFRVTEWRLGIRKDMNQKDQDATQKAVDSLLNYETVKYFSAEGREAERYDLSMQGFERAAVRSQTSLAFLNIGQAVLITGGLVLVMILAAGGVQRGELTVGDFVLVNAFMIQLMMPLNFLGTVYREIRQSLIDMKDMFDLIDQPAEIVDAPGATALDVRGGAVRFHAADFHYESSRQILHGVSFEIPPGKMLAIVGPTGSGKSTVGRLLYRFYDVTGGAIEIDGQDIRQITQASLRSAIGVVPQDSVLFNDTIGYNIGYGALYPTQAQIESAAKAAQIHDFIAALPEGYDTMVGERGLKLSGGEKQRVAIARAILKNPAILILDEATSALDSTTEREIQGSLKHISTSRTVIAVAHRLSTIVHADEIIVLDGGRVVERGTHAELLKRGGAYARLWTQQESEEPLPA